VFHKFSLSIKNDENFDANELLELPLSYNVRETSGLIYLNGKLITHNDSGGEPALYELDTITGNVTFLHSINV